MEVLLSFFLYYLKPFPPQRFFNHLIVLVKMLDRKSVV